MRDWILQVTGGGLVRASLFWNKAMPHFNSKRLAITLGAMVLVMLLASCADPPRAGWAGFRLGMSRDSISVRAVGGRWSVLADVTTGTNQGIMKLQSTDATSAGMAGVVLSVMLIDEEVIFIQAQTPGGDFERTRGWLLSLSQELNNNYGSPSEVSKDLETLAPDSIVGGAAVEISEWRGHGKDEFLLTAIGRSGSQFYGRTDIFDAAKLAASTSE